MRRLLCFLLIYVLISPVSAQDAEPVSAFDDAWQEYVEARQSENQRRIVSAAKKALDIGRQSFSAKDERLPALMTLYGNALMDVRRKEAAREVLEEALGLTKELHGTDSAKMIPVLMSFADANAESRESGRQERYYRQALKISRDQHGKDSVEYADILFRAGAKILDLSNTDAGKRHLRNAHEIYATRLGEEDNKTAMAAFYLGKIELSYREHGNATNYFLDALRGFTAEDSPDIRSEMIARAFLVEAYESRNMSAEATEHCLAIGANSMISPDQDFLPIFRMAPKYPTDMYRQNKQGHVDVAYSVDESGFVRDATVIAVEGDESFKDAAIKAVERFRYAPKFVNGEPVVADNVKARITFKIKN